MAYRGGKSMLAGWVAGLLPYRHAYVEPCVGMGSVLCARRPSTVEVVNDADGRVVAFWRALRDHPDRLADRVAATPYGRAAYVEARRLLADTGRCHDDVTVGAAVAVVLSQGLLGTLDPDGDPSDSPPGDAGWWRVVGKHVRSQRRMHRWQHLPERLLATAARLRDVVLEDVDALDLLAEWAPQADVAVYLDPPYVHTSGYAHQFDHHAAAELLSGARAAVAVSGYRTCPWDALGWDRLEQTVTLAGGVKRAPRTECLWVNFDAPRQTVLDW